MSYQNVQDDLIVIEKEEREETGLKLWKVIMSVVVVGTLGVLGLSYSSNGFKSQLSSVLSFKSSSYSLTDRLEMAYSGSIMYTELSSSEKKSLFEVFKEKYSKQYEEEEEDDKYKNFKTFLELIDTRNAEEEAAGGSARHGVTMFADLSSEEFESKYLSGVQKNTKEITFNGFTWDKVKEAYHGDVTAVNWAGKYTTPVKDQGYCGSCWAFSASEQIESDSIRQGYLTTDDELSPQQIVSCDTNSYGCNGGTTELAYYYVYQTGGLEKNVSYPYTGYWGQSGTCKEESQDYVVTVDGFYSLEDEDSMKAHVLSTGPLSVCLDASKFSTYESGVVTSCGTDVDHCVQATGVDTDQGYWIVRNSWSEDWGDKGYIYLKTDQNTCDISYDPTYVSVKNLQK